MKLNLIIVKTRKEYREEQEKLNSIYHYLAEGYADLDEDIDDKPPLRPNKRLFFDDEIEESTFESEVTSNFKIAIKLNKNK